MRTTNRVSAPLLQRGRKRLAGIASTRIPVLISPKAREALEELARCFARAAVDAMLAELEVQSPAVPPVPNVTPVSQDLESSFPPALPDTGFLQLRDIVGDRRRGKAGIIPVSPATWYGWIAKGQAPKPVKLGTRSVWPAEDIRALIKRLSAGIPLEPS